MCVGGVALVGRMPIFSPRCHLVSVSPALRLGESCSKHGFVLYTQVIKQLLILRCSQGCEGTMKTDEKKMIAVFFSCLEV